MRLDSAPGERWGWFGEDGSSPAREPPGHQRAGARPAQAQQDKHERGPADDERAGAWRRTVPHAAVALHSAAWSMNW